jgi:hypothetical protein
MNFVTSSSVREMQGKKRCAASLEPCTILRNIQVHVNVVMMYSGYVFLSFPCFIR